MTDIIRITENTYYIKSSDTPLSADVIFVDGQEYLYVFDVGNSQEVAEYINSIPKKKRVILSHFHPDHMGNIGRVEFETVFFGANTEGYLKNYIADYAKERFQDLPGALLKAFGEDGDNKKNCFAKYETVFEPVRIEDGISLEIHPVPNSHARGSLLFMVDNNYILIGDSLYSKIKGEQYVYNAQLLKEEIALLKELPAEHIFSSHEREPVKGKAGVVRFLQSIYEKKTKSDAYIYIER